MENSFEIDIPMKDHPMVIMVKPRSEDGSYDLFYCDELCGCFFKNENEVWIYEPHAHAALLLNAEQLQHLGQEIDRHQ